MKKTLYLISIIVFSLLTIATFIIGSVSKTYFLAIALVSLIIDGIFIYLYAILPSTKESIGNYHINKTISNYVSWYKGFRLNDKTFKIEDRTFKVDKIVVCTKGIFLINTPSVIGVVYGEEEDLTWTLKERKSLQENVFDNPCLSLKELSLSLSNLLNTKVCYCVSFICGDIIHVHSKSVVNPSNVYDFMKYEFKEDVLNPQQIEEIRQKLNELSK